MHRTVKWHKNRQTYIHACIHTDRQTHTHADKYTDRLTDRQSTLTAVISVFRGTRERKNSHHQIVTYKRKIYIQGVDLECYSVGQYWYQ